MIKPETSLQFKNGQLMRNRFALAPLTNLQSNSDGTLGNDEFNWVTKRAQGGFGMVMTCASHVSKNGQGFPGQLGIFNDDQIEGHAKLASTIKEHGSLTIIQLHHAGMRSPKELIGEAPLCPSNNEKFNAVEMTELQVVEMINDFISAAKRAQIAGYNGVELHGAHGYILAQFLSPEINQRNDQYGGSFENRSRVYFEIIDGIRNECGNDFLLGIRLSPERFGLELSEVIELTQQLILSNKIDFLDISIWDYNKFPEEEKYQDKKLLEYFTELDYKNVKLTVAGKIKNGIDVQNVLKAGVDFVCIGRSGILHYDFPLQVIQNPSFERQKTPVSVAYLQNQGLGPAFIEYMKNWAYFVEE